MRRRKAVVILLTVEEFALLEARAQAVGRDTYEHANDLLVRSLHTEREPNESQAASALE